MVAWTKTHGSARFGTASDDGFEANNATLPLLDRWQPIAGDFHSHTSLLSHSMDRGEGGNLGGAGPEPPPTPASQKEQYYDVPGPLPGTLRWTPGTPETQQRTTFCSGGLLKYSCPLGGVIVIVHVAKPKHNPKILVWKAFLCGPNQQPQLQSFRDDRPGCGVRSRCRHHMTAPQDVPTKCAMCVWYSMTSLQASCHA